jgi:tetratricopeptide (TPR) repeat protein
MNGIKACCASILFAAAATLAFLPLGAAAPADDAHTCSKGFGDDAIAACTDLLASGRYEGHGAAAVHVARGSHYSRAKGNLDRAIADYDEAIRLDPKYALAYYNRG